MALVNAETGELLDSAAAERRAERIRLRLDAIADNYQAVLPMIREAIEKRDDLALGYRSVGEYVSDRFGGALNNLGIEVRREVVRELTEAGMSSRAIAPVVGVSDRQVRYDAEQVGSVSHLETPRQVEPGDDDVVGIDGKSYRPRKNPMPNNLTRLPSDVRVQQITELADKGATSEQIAKSINLSEQQVRHLAKRHDVTITADAIRGKRHRIDQDRVLDNVTEALEVAAISLRDLDPQLLDREKTVERIDSLTESLKAIRKAVTKISQGVAP